MRLWMLLKPCKKGKADLTATTEQLAASSNIPSDVLSKTDQRMAALEQTLKDLSEVSTGEEGAVAGVAAIAQRVNSIETRVGDQISHLKQEPIGRAWR